MALDLAAVNEMQRDAFVDALGSTFEHSPWVAEGAWAARPFASVEALHAAMIGVVTRAPRDTQIAFLRAHPELAGKEAQAGLLTEHSAFEQQGTGLSALSRDELPELRRLNAEYAKRHGFPFIIAVLNNTKTQIFDALRMRASRGTSSEIDEALAQISQITRRRLDALFLRA